MKMKGLSFLTILGVLAVLGVTSAHAQLSATVTADVPFEFMAGGKTMPAGQYIVKRHVLPDSVLVRNLDTNATVNLLAHAVSNSSLTSEAVLVFNKYGNRYFLSQVWGAQGSGSQVIKSRSEREWMIASANSQSVLVSGGRP